jgi:hypothetical protein
MMNHSSWCMVDVGGDKIRARIAHTGRGRFRVEEDMTGKYEGKVIDASDVISCNIDRAPAQDSSAYDFRRRSRPALPSCSAQP